MQVFNTIKIDFIPFILGMAFTLALGYAIGYFLRKLFTEYQIKEAEVRRQKIIKETEKEVESRFKLAEIETKEKFLVLKSGLENEMRAKRDSLSELEKELEKKDRELRNEIEKFQLCEQEVKAKSAVLDEKEKDVE